MGVTLTYFALNVLHSVSHDFVAVVPPTSMHEAVQRFESLYVQLVASHTIPDIHSQLCFSIIVHFLFKILCCDNIMGKYDYNYSERIFLYGNFRYF